jgi:hypothetical protein
MAKVVGAGTDRGVFRSVSDQTQSKSWPSIPPSAAALSGDPQLASDLRSNRSVVNGLMASDHVPEPYPVRFIASAARAEVSGLVVVRRPRSANLDLKILSSKVPPSGYDWRLGVFSSRAE